MNKVIDFLLTLITLLLVGIYGSTEGYVRIISMLVASGLIGYAFGRC